MVEGFASYSVGNDALFQRKIIAATRVVEDLRFAFSEISRDWFKSNITQFSLKGSGQYPPLSPAYAERKARLFGSKPILVATGKLRDSVTGGTNKDSINRIGKQSLVVGTKVEYGIYHQSDKPRRIIPLRKFLFLGPEAPRSAPSEITGRVERWLSIMDAEVKRQLEKI